MKRGERFYRLVRGLGRLVFNRVSSPRIFHEDRLPSNRAYLLAANHLSYFDVPCLIVKHPRPIDWVSITELFQNPLTAWFFGNMNAFPMNRAKPEKETLQIALDRLRSGAVVGMFPEGGIRTEQDSVLNGGPIKSGIAFLAEKAGALVIPCVILETARFGQWTNWLPFRRTRFVINYGEPLFPDFSIASKHDRRKKLETELRESFQNLYGELLSLKNQ